MKPAAPPADQELSFRDIVEQSIAGVYVIQDEVFVYSNETWAGFFGRTREELVGLTLRDLVPPDAVDVSLRHYHRRASGEVASVRYVTPAIHKDGHRIYLEVHGTRTMYRGRIAVTGVGIDISEQVHRTEELRQARQDLQALAAHINRDREEQRARIARELHDVLGGLLASIKMDAKRIARRVADPQVKEITSGLMEVTREAIQTVRDMSEELRPGALDHLGLQAALGRELARFGQRYDIVCRFDSQGPLEAVDAMASHRKTSLYRIFQEGLTNVAKHAQAREVTLHLALQGDELLLQIDDDGAGLTPDETRCDARGILGMQERARELGGSLCIEALPERGTRLQLTIPVAP